ncbi:DUF7692 domain-containing protein [Halovenus marina]|uniref:DUF7692 domain-containing protein n=1 Tax=Halovenus marina TaxID=3396621 RepID=UPI003F55DC5D
MRINTDGNQSYREDLYERVADKLGESTKTGGIDAACIHAEQDLRNKQDAIEYLAGELSAEELAEVADILSTKQIPLSVETDIQVSGCEVG